MNENAIASITQTLLTAAGTLGGWEALRYMLNRRANTRINNAQAAEAELSTLRHTMEFLQSELQRQEEHFARQNAEIRRLNAEVLSLTRRLAVVDLLLRQTRCDTPGCPNRTQQPMSDEDTAA